MGLDTFTVAGWVWGAVAGGLVAAGWWWRERLNARPLTLVATDIHAVLDVLEAAGRELAPRALLEWVQPGRPLEGQWRLVAAPLNGDIARDEPDERSEAADGAPVWHAEVAVRVHGHERREVVTAATWSRFRFALRQALAPDISEWVGPQLISIRGTPRLAATSRPWTPAAHRRWYCRQVALAFLQTLESGLARRSSGSGG